MDEGAKDKAITNQLLLAILNELYSVELLLSDANIDKLTFRRSNDIVYKDGEVLDAMTKLVEQQVEKL